MAKIEELQDGVKPFFTAAQLTFPCRLNVTSIFAAS